jgi:hypothetical protein
MKSTVGDSRACQWCAGRTLQELNFPGQAAATPVMKHPARCRGMSGDFPGRAHGCRSLDKGPYLSFNTAKNQRYSKGLLAGGRPDVRGAAGVKGRGDHGRR